MNARHLSYYLAIIGGLIGALVVTCFTNVYLYGHPVTLICAVPFVALAAWGVSAGYAYEVAEYQACRDRHPTGR